MDRTGRPRSTTSPALDAPGTGSLVVSSVMSRIAFLRAAATSCLTRAYLLIATAMLSQQLY